MAYNYTEVAPEKSQGQIKKLLIAHGASNVQFGSSFEPMRENYCRRFAKGD